MALTRPPPEITPQAFFDSWLPAEYQRLRAAAGNKTPPDATIVIALEGDGGGAWTLKVERGELTTAAGDTAGADLRVAQTVRDWRAIVIGEDAASELIPSSANPVDLLLAADPAQAAQLKTVRGSLRFEITSFNSRTWWLETTFNGTTEPKASITVDSATLRQITNGTVSAPQAYFSGQIQIGGDAAFAMQLAMQMMSSRRA